MSDNLTTVGSMSQPSPGAVDFANLLAGTENDIGRTPLATPYVPAAGSDASVSAAYSSSGIGVPDDIDSYVVPPGLESSTAAVSGGSPIFSSIQNVYEAAKNDVSGAIASVGSTAKQAFTGITSIGSNIAGAAVTGIKSTLMWILFIVAGLFVGIYFIGKSGIVGQAASVR